MTTNVETTSAAAGPQGRPARWARRFGWWFYVTVMVAAPFVLVLAAVVGAYVWWKLADMKAAHEVKQEVARVQALGEPVTILDLYAWHRVPEGTSDSTALWLAALAASDAILIAKTKYVDVPIVGHSQRESIAAGHPQSKLDLAEDFLKSNDEAVQAALTASRLHGQCRLPVAFEAFAPLLSTQRARGVARLMALRTYVAIERDNTETAVESVEANLALVGAIDHQPTIADHLVRIAIIGVVMSDIELLLNQQELNEAQLTRLQRLAQTIEIQNGFTASLVGERGIGFHEFHQFPPGPRIATAAEPMAGGKLIRPADCDFYLQLIQEYIDASRLPFPKSINESKQIAARVQSVAQSTNPLERMRYVLSMQVVPGMQATFAASARVQAMRNLNL